MSQQATKKIKKRVRKANPSLRPEDDAIQPGAVVMLPDGAIAAVEKIVGEDAYVVEWQKVSGRGPWIFPVVDLVLVS